MTRRQLTYGVFCSVFELQTVINRFIADHNAGEAKPLIWKAEPDAIMAARNRGFQTLESIHWLPKVILAANSVDSAEAVRQHHQAAA